jgi:hypothetical protein
MIMKIRVALALAVLVTGSAFAEKDGPSTSACSTQEAEKQCAMEVANIPGATPYDKVVNLYARGKIFNPADMEGVWTGRYFVPEKPATPYGSVLAITTRPVESRGPLFCRDFLLTMTTHENTGFFDTYGTAQESSVKGAIQARLPTVKTAIAQADDVLCDNSTPGVVSQYKVRKVGPFLVGQIYYKGGSSSSTHYAYFFRKVGR